MTTYSHAEPATLSCPGCGQSIATEIWTIVDIDERPDLLARLLNETIHTVTCPKCGHVAVVNAPLLIIRQKEKPVLLFSPARGFTPEEDEEHAVALVGMLREHLGQGWQNDWLGDGVSGIARDALPRILSDDPRTLAALATAAAQDDEVPIQIRDTLERIMVVLANEGVRVSTAEDLVMAIESRPELKSALRRAFEEANASPDSDLSY